MIRTLFEYEEINLIVKIMFIITARTWAKEVHIIIGTYKVTTQNIASRWQQLIAISFFIG